MSIERTPRDLSYLEVLDRVLDKGIVIDGWIRVSVVGVELVTVRGTVIVSSISTYLKHSGEFSASGSPSPRAFANRRRARNRRRASGETGPYSPPWLHQLLDGLG